MVEVFQLQDKRARNHIDCELKDDVVKMKLGDKEAFVSQDDLYALCLLILTPEKRDSLIPVRQTRITKYVRQHKVRVKKNINKGEEVIVNCEIDVPTVVEENIKHFIKPKSNLLIP